jgi:ABC-type xylose transport system permease subunit
MKKDFFSGILCSCFGILLWLTIPVSIPHDDPFSQMGPRFFPAFLAAALTVLGVILAVRASIQKSKWKTETPVRAAELAREIPVALLFFIMIASCLLFAFFRYIISMPVAVTVMLLLFRVRKWQSYCILYLFVAAFYFIFVKLMYVQL